MTDHSTPRGWLYGEDASRDRMRFACARPLRVVLLGPPGVGKGTQAELITREFGTCHLSTGDLFRAAKCAAQVSPAMKAALAVMQRGELVADDLVITLVRERSACLRCQGGFLLDGFPRTIPQAQSLEEILTDLDVELDAVLAFELPLEEIVSRLGGRRTCPECRSVFHVPARPPRVDGRCDQCGSNLVQREDDQERTIRVRMRIYDEAMGPLLDYYERQGKLVRIAAHGTPEAVFQRAKTALMGRIDVESRTRAMA